MPIWNKDYLVQTIFVSSVWLSSRQDDFFLVRTSSWLDTSLSCLNEITFRHDKIKSRPNEIKSRPDDIFFFSFYIMAFLGLCCVKTANVRYCAELQCIALSTLVYHNQIKSPVTSWFFQQYVQANNQENAKVPYHPVFVRVIHRWPMDFLYKGAVMTSNNGTINSVSFLLRPTRSVLWYKYCICT